MAGSRVVATVIVGLIVLAVGASLAPIPFGKPSPWQLIAAPKVVNTEYLIRDSGEPDYTWTVHLNSVRVGLDACSDFDSPAPRAGDTGVFYSRAKDIELENTGADTILRVGNTAYRYNCVADGASSATIDALLGCEVDPWRSLFA